MNTEPHSYFIYFFQLYLIFTDSFFKSPFYTVRCNIRFFPTSIMLFSFFSWIFYLNVVLSHKNHVIMWEIP